MAAKVAEIVGSPVERARSRVEASEGELKKLLVEIDATRTRIREGAVAERDTEADEKRLAELEGRRVGLSVRLEGLRPAFHEAEKKAAAELAAKRRVEDEKQLVALAEKARVVRREAVGGGRDFLAGLARLDALSRQHDTIAARLGDALPLQVERTSAGILLDASALVLDELSPDSDPVSQRVVVVEVGIPVLG